MSEYIPSYADFLAENIVIEITKNTQPAPQLGATYGQDVEAAGTYVRSGSSNLPGHLNGRAVLKKPLYVQLTDDNQIEYKRELSKKWNAKGKRLTTKLMQAGHDAIITVYPNGEYGEIVLFPNAQFMLG